MPTPSSRLQQQLCMIIKPCVSPKLGLGGQVHTWMTTAVRHPSGLGRAAGLPHTGTPEADTVLNGLPWIGRAFKIHVKKPKIKVS